MFVLVCEMFSLLLAYLPVAIPVQDQNLLWQAFIYSNQNFSSVIAVSMWGFSGDQYHLTYWQIILLYLVPFYLYHIIYGINKQ